MLKATAGENAEKSKTERWTYLDVVIDKVELVWGPADMIPAGERDDVDKAYRTQTSRDETAIVTALADQKQGDGTLDPAASYDIDLPKGFTLQTVMLGEWTDADTGVLQSEAMRLIVGTNVLWKKDRIRVMPQAEFIRPLGKVSALNPWVERDTYYVFLAVEI